MQRRQFIRLMFAGQLLWALTWFIFQGAAPTRVQAQPPRPTLTPAPSAIPRSRSDDDQDNEPLATGRITGTVIDLASGAPASGIRVAVSDVTIITDANGNYDRSGLPPGTYVVTLVLTEDQGTPAQGPVTIKLTPGATVVQHLAFRGITRASPT